MDDAAGEAMAAVLAERLKDVRHSLHRYSIPGDGHCQYRAVSVQCRGYGFNAFDRLRAKVIKYVTMNREDYRPFFNGSNPDQQLDSWIHAAEGGEWGDTVSLHALSRVLRRPMAVWTCNSAQPPTV